MIRMVTDVAIRRIQCPTVPGVHKEQAAPICFFRVLSKICKRQMKCEW